MSKKMKYKVLAYKEKYDLTYDEIASFCQVVKNTVVFWAKIPLGDAHSIPSDKLRLLATLFDVPMEGLYNQKVKIVKDTNAVKAFQKVRVI